MASNIQPIFPGPGIGSWQDAYTWTFAEGASQSFVIGAPLTFSSGKVIIVPSVTTPFIGGISMCKASGTAGSQATPLIQVALPVAGLLFEVSVDTTTTSGDAALGTGYPSEFNVGSSYQMLLDATSGNYYMGTDTSNAVFQLMGYSPDQASVINGRVLVRILTSQTAYN